MSDSQSACANPPTLQNLIQGQWVDGLGQRLVVRDKFTLQPWIDITVPDEDQVKHAVESAHNAFRSSTLSAFDRGAILDRAANLLAARLDDFIKAMQHEAGFTKSDATGEANRCIQTLKLSGEEARRLAGDVIPLMGAPNQKGRIGFTLRVPLGVVAAITPFNAPLNTVAHKVGPAIAAGNAVILKPSTHTPKTACMFAQLFLDAGMPPGLLSVLHGSAEVVKHLQNSRKVKYFAFTGSTEVGRIIQAAAGLRRTQMELGSIAFTIVCDDADLSMALPKVVNAGYRKAGQVCTSVQLLLVHSSRVKEVEIQLAGLVQALSFGDPHQENTFVGPVISEEAAVRIESWIKEAVSKGATLLAGGPRVGAVIPPTLLTHVASDMKVGCNEIFGPVVCIMPFDDFDQAIEKVNSTPFGLATGVFTNRLSEAISAAHRLEVGGVHINETSSSRVDLMPYGGSKDSGFGREGPAYAVHEMSEERIVTITT
jgi:succinate-semialdehyde dehydrogenase/glutarate-semialdehyde dehydrogenase